MNSKLLKIAMCLMLVGGIAGMQNGYSMQQRGDNALPLERQKLSSQMIQQNQYLQRILKGKNIKGNGFADYKDTYKFTYDSNKITSLANPSETALSSAMSTVKNAIDKLDFKLANKSLMTAKNVVLNANKAVLELRKELEHLMGVEDSYCNTLDDMDAQKAKIQENINYYTQQIQILNAQVEQIEEKSGYVDAQYGLLKNTMSHAIDFITKYHSATEAARKRLVTLAKDVQKMQTEINDIKIDENEIKRLNETVTDINLEMQNNLVNMNEQELPFKKPINQSQRQYPTLNNIINEEIQEYKLEGENNINEHESNEQNNNQNSSFIKIEKTNLQNQNPNENENDLGDSE